VQSLFVLKIAVLVSLYLTLIKALKEKGEILALLLGSPFFQSHH